MKAVKTAALIALGLALSIAATAIHNCGGYHSLRASDKMPKYPLHPASEFWIRYAKV